MMGKRKRVALFANCWASDYVSEVGRGICACAEKEDVDIFAFMNYSAHLSSVQEQRGEFNIFLLPDLRDFDGVFLLTNTFNLKEERTSLHQEVRDAGIPTVTLEYELEGIDCLKFDNYPGMYELASHLIREHGVRKIVFIGGIEGHADSDMRLKAVTDAAAENQITIRDEDILYGSWDGAEAGRQLEFWLEKNGSLPDAVVCANDMMAVGVCDWLDGHGYRVPEDVKVTGYDCIDKAQKYKPVITSVNHEWADMGYRALQLLLAKIEGKEIPSKSVMKSRLVIGESCGCSREGRNANTQEELGRVVSNKMADGVETDRHFRHLYTSLRKVETLGEFHRSISALFANEHDMEGNTFMLCIRPDFFVVEDNYDRFRIPGYGDCMDAVCYLNGGVAEECRQIPTRKAIFWASERSGSRGDYLFVPVRSDDMHLGFAMLGRNFDIVSDLLLYIWTRHVDEYMEQVLSNIKIAELTRKLQELSVTDVLTGLYNRMGCEKKLYPFAEECQNRGEQIVVILADIDRMKTINDQYGHAQGDLALQIVARILKTELPRGFLAARFGGDEFFIVGECHEAISIEEISKHVTEQLAKEVWRRQIQFPLTVSIGGIRLEKGEPFQLMDCLQRVDEAMYRIKEIHHRKIDGQE